MSSKWLVALAVLAAAPVCAQDETVAAFGNPVTPRAGDEPQDAFGGGLSTSVIQVAAYQEVQSGNTWQHPVPGYLNALVQNFSPNLYAPLNLDNGVEITQVCANVYDASNTLSITMFVGAFESGSGATAPVFAALATVTTGTTQTPNYTLLCATLNPVITIRNDADLNNGGGAHTVQYWVGFTLPVGTTVAVGPAVVTWRRTVSPAPGAATFTDVPTSHPFFRFVEALAASGITGGCGGGNFCPDTALTRGQMAVFLSTALGLHWPN